MASDVRDRFYRATRGVLRTRYRARVTLAAALAAGGPLAALALLIAAPDLSAAARWTAGALGLAWAAAGVSALRALLAPIERMAAELRCFAEGRADAPPLGDAPAQIARGIEALSKRLDAATRRADPTRLEDPLTGLPNRLAAMRRGRDEITRARRAGAPLAVAMIAFEEAGPSGAGAAPARMDVALRICAEAMVQSYRAYDVLARWDGPRFVAILPEAEIENGVAATERAAEAAQEFLGAQGFEAVFRIRAGVAVLQPDDATLADVASRAAEALDRALSRPGPHVMAAPGPRTRPVQLTSV